MTPPRLPLTRALVELIRERTGRPCGWSALPTDGRGVPVATPYTVLDSLPALGFDGPGFSDWHADVLWTYQVTSVGDRGDQVEWLADRIRDTVVGRAGDGWRTPLRIAGQRVIDRELTADGAGEPAEGSQGSIVTYVQRFTLRVTAD